MRWITIPEPVTLIDSKGEPVKFPCPAHQERGIAAGCAACAAIPIRTISLYELVADVVCTQPTIGTGPDGLRCSRRLKTALRKPGSTEPRPPGEVAGWDESDWAD